MSTPWSLDNVYTSTVKSCKGVERVPDASNWDLLANGQNPDRKNIDPPGLLGVSVRYTIQPRKIIMCEIREQRPGPTQGCRAMMMMMTEERPGPTQGCRAMMMMMTTV
jgi:hypothetical protein